MNMRNGLLRAGALAGVVAAAAFGGEFDARGGWLALGGSLSAGRVSIGSNATLTGGGTVRGDVRVEGLAAPGGASTNVMAIDGALQFAPGAILACHAASHSMVSGFAVSGAVGGCCRVQLTRDPAAVPLGEAIIRGGPASDFALFAVAAPGDKEWRLDIPGDGRLLATHVCGDSDGDGTPDWWEQCHFGGRTNCASAADQDRDGLSNIGEWIAGTDPTNACSALRIVAFRGAPDGAATLLWTSVTGRVYDVERFARLDAGVQHVVASNVAATPPTNACGESLAGETQSFYRVKVRLP